jgi:hypothetical protein
MQSTTASGKHLQHHDVGQQRGLSEGKAPGSPQLKALALPTQLQALYLPAQAEAGGDTA